MSGKYNQYLNGSPKATTQFDQKVDDFMDFLNEIGLIATKNDGFIIKRRFKMLAKDAKGKFSTTH